MWTLIIILNGTFGAAALTIGSVDGFPTPKSCNDAGLTITSMPTGNAFTARTRCIFKPLPSAAAASPPAKE